MKPPSERTTSPMLSFYATITSPISAVASSAITAAALSSVEATVVSSPPLPSPWPARWRLNPTSVFFTEVDYAFAGTHVPGSALTTRHKSVPFRQYSWPPPFDLFFFGQRHESLFQAFSSFSCKEYPQLTHRPQVTDGRTQATSTRRYDRLQFVC